MNKGNYYKHKTKKWFENKGYFAEYLEKQQRIYDKKRNKIIFVKKDIAGADGLAMNEHEIIFWNSKAGTSSKSAGIKEFAKYPFPRFVKLWLVCWKERQSEPEIIEVNDIIYENPD